MTASFAMMMDQADRFRDRVVACVAHAIPATEAARERLMALRVSLDGVDSSMWHGIAELDRAFGGSVAAGIDDHIARIAAGAAACDTAAALLHPFLPMVEAARRQRAADTSAMGHEHWGPSWRLTSNG